MSDNLVKIVDKEPRVSSFSLEEAFGTDHKFVIKLIRTHKSKLEKFGILPLAGEKLNSGRGRPRISFYLNEKQTLLLLTYTKSREKTDSLRIELINQFVKMKDYIREQQIRRQIGIETRRSLTDAIKESGENERMHGHGYRNYTKLAYKIAGIEKNGRDDLTPDELSRLKDIEAMIKILVDQGKEYAKIKDDLGIIFQ